MRTILGGVALLLTVAMAASGCGGGSPDSTPPASTSPAAPSPSTPPDPKSQASAAAQAMIEKYFATTDHIGQDPSTPLSLLRTVAVSTLLTAERNTLSQWRSKGWKQTGDTKVTKMQVGTISLDNSHPAKGKVPYVTIDVCVDASATRVTDRAGKQVGQPVSALTTRYTVANYHWDTDPANGWRVAVGEDQEVGKCTL